MTNAESGTLPVKSLDQWVNALYAMYEQPTNVQRILWADMYQESDCLDITEAVSADFPEAQYLTGESVLPVMKLGEAALAKWIVLPPVICDMARISSDFVDKLDGRTARGHRFVGLPARLGSVNFGWHIDGVLGPSHVNHLTAYGKREGSFIKITDEARIRAIAAKEVVPNQDEIEAAVHLTLDAPTLVTFSPNYRSDRGIFPDMHEFHNLQAGSVSYVLNQRELNDKALVVFERIVERVPALAAYHPEEVAKRTVAFAK